MPIFIYKAKNREGTVVRGEIEAQDQLKALKLLKEQDLFITQIQEKEEKIKLWLPFLGGVSLKEKAIFTRELAVMIKAGLPIVSALKSLSEQIENKRFKKIIKRVAIEVEGGKLLSDVLNKYPEIFSKLYVNTIKSGEKGGKLEEILVSLSESLQKDYELNSRIKGAMIYPAFILSALVAVLIIIFVYVLPQLTQLFSSLGATLPWQTKILMASSEFFLKFWWLVLIVVIGIGSFLRFWLKTSSGIFLFDQFKLRIPLVSPLLKKIYMARFCRSSSILIKAGLPLVEVIKTVSGVINNAVYQKELEMAARQVENGVPLSNALKQSTHFPSMVSHLTTVGEASGTLDAIFDDLALYYDGEIEISTKALSSLIEPILIALIGIAVAFVIISVIKPIYGLTEIM